jgi:hypothetical protein
MSIHLDHLMVPSRNKLAGAKLLAELLGVPWSPDGVGPFAPVFVNEGLTLDFDEWAEPIALIHYCFRVDEQDFDAILARIQARALPIAAACMGPSTTKSTPGMADASSTGTSRTDINGRCSP